MTKLALVALSLSVWMTSISAQIAGTSITMPGTGISIVAPAGMRLAKVGAALVDGAGTTTISFAYGGPGQALDNDVGWRSHFTHPAELTEGRWPGKLYRRTRDEGGGWDGWMLILPIGEKVLSVAATYSGASPAEFEQLKGHILSTSWQDSPISPETAMGVSFQPEGLGLVLGIIGGMTYMEPQTRKIGLVVMPLSAIPPPSAAQLLSVDCQQAVSRALRTSSEVSPTREKGDYTYCEAWHRESDATPYALAPAAARMGYYALVRPTAGTPFVVTGIAPREDFRAALQVFRQAVSTLRLATERGTDATARSTVAPSETARP